jgi:hypothetical protein
LIYPFTSYESLTRKKPKNQKTMKHLLILITCVVLVFSNIKIINVKTIFINEAPLVSAKSRITVKQNPTLKTLTVCQFIDIWLENPYLNE